jgi:hypothetical protein
MELVAGCTVHLPHPVEKFVCVRVCECEYTYVCVVFLCVCVYVRIYVDTYL